LICVDASLVVAWLLPEELSEKALSLRRRLEAAGESLIAPALLLAEVSSVVRRNVFLGQIDAGSGDDAFAAFRQFPIQFHDLASLTDSAWSLAKQVNSIRTYDMFYLALAHRESCDLWTADRRLLNLVANASSHVRWVGDEEVP
jgi:predicted nucleic acid-binding protein